MVKRLASCLVLGWVLGLVMMTLLGSPWAATAALPYKSAIKDARVILRNALPIDNPTIRSMQLALEKMPRQANLKQWGVLRKQVEELNNVVAQNLNDDQGKILAAVTDLREGRVLLADLGTRLQALQVEITSKERNKIKPLSEFALERVGELEALMVQAFPFTIPEEYAGLPRLLGRATVELETSKGKLNLVLDGYNAPITAGQFADLVQRGFYDNMEFSRADDNYFLQAGDPPGDADGFIDPETHQLRTIPMEVKVPGQTLPIYGKTFAEMGTYGVLPVLPFSAYGTLAMAHPDRDPNGGSSQFFIYLFESDLTPAGLNLIDGNFAAFGYVLDGQPVLDKMKLGDRIISAKITGGAENLVLPGV